MLIIKNDGKMTIERMLKIYKRKYDKTKVIKQLRERETFTKKSVIDRQEKKLAIYKQGLNDDIL